MAQIPGHQPAHHARGRGGGLVRLRRCHHRPEVGGHVYTARIAIPDNEMTKLGELKLIAGMPVDFIRTSDRSVMSYLAKPMTDQVARAFREK